MILYHEFLVNWSTGFQIFWDAWEQLLVHFWSQVTEFEGTFVPESRQIDLYQQW